MKKNIHPAYYPVTMKCSCGHTFEIRSTKQHLETEICSRCHPFYTGSKKIVDAAGRVEKFKRRYAKAKT